MGKEKIITIVIGLVVGIALSGGIFLFWNYKDNLIKSNPTTKPQPQKTETPSATAAAIKLDSPEDNLITKEKSIEVSGHGQVQMMVLIVATAEEKTINVGQDGTFKTTVKLEEGENRISVIYFDPSPEPKSLDRTVTVEI